jgi:heterodisulfide reductase subunit A-like polyferredoxin
VRIKTLVCNCKGSSPFFGEADMNRLMFEIERGVDVDYAIAHQELCGLSGDRVMQDVFRSADVDPHTLVVVGACDPEAQLKLFQKAFLKTGFNPKHFIAVDIRGETNQGILERLREKIGEHVRPREKRH